MTEANSEALEILARPDSALTEVLKALATLDETPGSGRTVRIGIAANITVDLLADYLRRHAYLAGVQLEVIKGSYDDLLNDVNHFVERKVDQILIVPFFDNLRPAWESQLTALPPDARRAAVSSWLAQLKIALDTSRSIGRVTVAGSHLWNSAASAEAETLLNEFNDDIKRITETHPNASFFNTARVLSRIGEKSAFDARFYYRAKAPYTPLFLDEFARRYALATRGFGSHFYKVIVLDCDNTLWGGVVGEDGLSGIALDPYDYPGNVYWTVQQELRELEAQGVLLCLCSKNNVTDAEEVFSEHPHVVLRDEHLAAKKLNWEPKVTNLLALASELNLGLESFIFIDDSDFELEAVRKQLPQVKVIQVPKKLADYPTLIHEVAALCTAGEGAEAGLGKTEHYKRLALSNAFAEEFDSHEDYLSSLDLTVRIHRDAREHTARIAELSQKSNQFNLTTVRYAPGEITALMEHEDTTVYSFEVSDRFGECGITGVIVVSFTSTTAEVGAFLMSCRVIGRGVEFAVWRSVLNDVRKRGKRRLVAAYLPTLKNAQVRDFFDRLGLPLAEETSDGGRRYCADVDSVRLVDNEWVELIDG